MEGQKTGLYANKVISGRYEILRLLGRGGMGEVYLCKDQMLDSEEIAIKILYPDMCRDEKHAKRFLREVQLTRKVSHANVVKAFDVGTHDGTLYLTMEYVPGSTLKDKISKGRISPALTARILHYICMGLFAVHEQGIIHRDLKPGNILLTEQGMPKVTDFGVARPDFSELTGHDEVIGSTHYMAPEVWIGQGICQATDLYALGVVAYEMLSGEAPFNGKSAPELMRQHLEVEPYSLLGVVDGIPLWLNTLVLRLLAKNPAERPPDADHVAEIIEYNLLADHGTDSQQANNSKQAAEEEENDDVFENIGQLESEIYTEAPAALDPVQPPLTDTDSIRVTKPQNTTPPSFMQATLSHLRRGLKLRGAHLFGLLLTFSLFVLVVQTYIAPLLAIHLWQPADSRTNPIILISAFVAPICIASALWAIPFGTLALRSFTYWKAIDVWLRSAMYLLALTCLFFLMYSSQYFRNSTEAREHFTIARSKEVAAAALHNALESGLFVSKPTSYSVRIDHREGTIKSSKQISWLQAILHPVLTLIFLCIVCRMLTRTVYRGVAQAGRFVSTAIFYPICALSLGEYLLHSELAHVSAAVGLATSTLRVGQFDLELSAYTQGCMLLNLGVLLFGVFVVIPWMMHRERTARGSF